MRVFPGAVSVLALLALAAPARAAAPQFTPLSATVLAAPVPVTGTDGRRHLVYELILQNVEDIALQMRSVQVRAAGGPTLASVSDAEIPAVMTDVVRRPASALAPGTGARLWLDVALPAGSGVPRALVHRLSVSATLPGGEARTFTFDGARTRVGRGRAPALSPPLRGGDYLNFNGCCGLSPHRVAVVPVDGTPFLSERFAVDFIQIDRQGRGGEGDLTRNESFFTFGEPVLAVAGARVISRRDGADENTPLVEPHGFTPETTAGNNVVLRLDDGRHALYAHLQKGSVRVRPGQRVRRGQVLARVGNTGQSGGPHLHFQLSDGPDAIASDGLPFVFERFTLVGEATNVEQFLTGAAPADVRQEASGARRGQHPLQSTVVRFGS